MLSRMEEEKTDNDMRLKQMFAYIKKPSLEASILALIYLFFFLFTFSIPSFSAIWPYNYLTIGFFVSLMILILFWVIKYRSLRIDNFSILLIIFNTVIFLSNLLNRNATFTTTYFTLSIVAFCLYQFCINSGRSKVLLCITYVSFLLFAVYFIFYYNVKLFDMSIERIGDDFDNLNTVGYYFLYAYALNLSFLKIRKPKTYFFLVPLLIFLFLILRTGSRSAFLIAVVISIIWIFVSLGKKKIWLSVLITLTLTIVLVVIIRLPALASFKKRIDTFLNLFTGNGFTDGSTNNRIDLVIESLTLFLKRPLLGWGNGVFQIYSSQRLFSHSNITQLLCDYGIVPPIIFEILLLYPLCKCIKLKSNYKLNVMNLLVLASIFFVQFFYVNSTLKFEYIFISIFFADQKRMQTQTTEILYKSKYLYRYHIAV